MSPRCVSHVTHAQMAHMTATRMPSATTSATSVIPCTAVSANQAMLATASSVEKTLTWMGGPMRTLSVWPMPLTTVKR